MKIALFSTILTLFSCFTAPRQYTDVNRKAVVDRKEARAAFTLLNEIRQHPQNYRRELGFGANARIAGHPLKWNETLAKVAEARALDMAKRNYFDHTDPDGFGPNYHINRAGYALNPDWLKRKTANNFESIGANHPSAIDGIKAMIIGRNSPGFGHRKHLLGMDEWNGSLQDIGIGFVRVPSGSAYQSYLCVIIAKHDW